MPTTGGRILLVIICIQKFGYIWTLNDHFNFLAGNLKMLIFKSDDTHGEPFPDDALAFTRILPTSNCLEKDEMQSNQYFLIRI